MDTYFTVSPSKLLSGFECICKYTISQIFTAGETEDSVEIPKVTDVSDEDTASQDQDGNAHKNLPGKC